MIIESKNLSFDVPWRFALVPRGGEALKKQVAANAQLLEIDGTEVRCLRSFHEEVAGDFFFASHYNCDPNASLTHLNAPVKGEQTVIMWHDAELMAEYEADDWQAVLCMFRAAMVTLHPQGTYLRLLFPTDQPSFLNAALHQALADEADRAGVGYDEAHENLELLLH